MELVKTVLQIFLAKTQDSIADQLKEGGSNEEKVRQMVQRELKEVKDSVKDLARKDLLSSLSFAEDGLVAMKNYKSTNDETSLSHAMDCFNKSIEWSTHAFENVSLSTQDRVLASKIKISATLLKLQKNPKLAIELTVKRFQQLCELNSVKKAFEYKSCCTKMFASKLDADIRQEVCSIKHAVYHNILSNKSTLDLEWPLPDWHPPYKFIAIVERHEHGVIVGLTSDQHTVVTITPDLSCRLVDVFTGDVVREFQVTPGFVPESTDVFLMELGFAQDPVRKLMYFAMWGSEELLILQVYDEEGNRINYHEVKGIDYIWSLRLKISVAGDKVVVANSKAIWVLVLTTEDKSIVSSRLFQNSWITGCAIIGEEIYLSEECINDKLLVLNMNLEDSREVIFKDREECSVRVHRMAYDAVTGHIIIADLEHQAVHVFTKQGDHLKKLKLDFLLDFPFVGPTGRILIERYSKRSLLLE